MTFTDKVNFLSQIIHVIIIIKLFFTYQICCLKIVPDIVISYPLFADVDTRIYLHTALQYHERPTAMLGIAMLCVDKFPYLHQQTRGNKFIPCSNNVCHILKCFRSFKIPATPLISPKSLYKHSVSRSHRSGKESAWWSGSPLWHHQWCSFCLYLILMMSNIRYAYIYFTVVSQSEVRVST